VCVCLCVFVNVVDSVTVTVGKYVVLHDCSKVFDKVVRNDRLIGHQLLDFQFIRRTEVQCAVHASLGTFCIFAMYKHDFYHLVMNKVIRVPCKVGTGKSRNKKEQTLGAGKCTTGDARLKSTTNRLQIEDAMITRKSCTG